MKPIIGITQDIEYKKDGAGFWAYLDKNYADAIYRFGGMPLMIPIIETAGAAAEYARTIDGLLLSGGDDINPKHYGEMVTANIDISPDARTEYEFILIKEMLALGKPVMGICLGIQAMNVFFGGALHQDIVGHRGKGHDVYHDVKVFKGSKLMNIVGAEELKVNSYHHQAIKTVADELFACAFSAEGIAEAVELPGENFVLGLQWHPERMQDDPSAERIFRAFIEACSKQ